MKFDTRLVTGIFIGMVVGLHYGSSLAVYLPVLTIATVILVLKTIRH